jgi:thymidine kinase
MNKIDQLLEKTIKDYHSLIEEYQYGNYIDESFIVEEVLFLKYNEIDCVKDLLFNSIIEYFLNNDYQNTKFQWM